MDMKKVITRIDIQSRNNHRMKIVQVKEIKISSVLIEVPKLIPIPVYPLLLRRLYQNKQAARI